MGVSDEDLTDGPEWDGDTGDLDEDPDLWLTPGERLAKVPLDHFARPSTSRELSLLAHLGG